VDDVRGPLASARRQRVVRVGSVVVWAVIWLLTGVVLKGASAEFGAMIPILVTGSLLGMSTVLFDASRAKLVGWLVMWAAIVGATVMILAGTPHLMWMLLVLAVGVAWYLGVAIVLWSTRQVVRTERGGGS
jgi:hypothetical protein